LELAVVAALGRADSLPDAALVALDGAVECGPPLPLSDSWLRRPGAGRASHRSAARSGRVVGWTSSLRCTPRCAVGKPHYGSV